MQQERKAKKESALSLLGKKDRHKILLDFISKYNDYEDDSFIPVFAHGATGLISNHAYPEYDTYIASGEVLYELLLAKSSEFKACVESGKLFTVFLFSCNAGSLNTMSIAAKLSDQNHKMLVVGANDYVNFAGIGADGIWGISSGRVSVDNNGKFLHFFKGKQLP